MTKFSKNCKNKCYFAKHHFTQMKIYNILKSDQKKIQSKRSHVTKISFKKYKITKKGKTQFVKITQSLTQIKKKQNYKNNIFLQTKQITKNKNML